MRNPFRRRIAPAPEKNLEFLREVKNSDLIGTVPQSTFLHPAPPTCWDFPDPASGSLGSIHDPKAKWRKGAEIRDDGDLYAVPDDAA
jgi:hypothetical protein